MIASMFLVAEFQCKAGPPPGKIKAPAAGKQSKSIATASPPKTDSAAPPKAPTKSPPMAVTSAHPKRTNAAAPPKTGATAPQKTATAAPQKTSTAASQKTARAAAPQTATAAPQKTARAAAPQTPTAAPQKTLKASPPKADTAAPQKKVLANPQKTAAVQKVAPTSQSNFSQANIPNVARKVTFKNSQGSDALRPPCSRSTSSSSVSSPVSKGVIVVPKAALRKVAQTALAAEPAPATPPPRIRLNISPVPESRQNIDDDPLNEAKARLIALQGFFAAGSPTDENNLDNPENQEDHDEEQQSAPEHEDGEEEDPEEDAESDDGTASALVLTHDMEKDLEEILEEQPDPQEGPTVEHDAEEDDDELELEAAEQIADAAALEEPEKENEEEQDEEHEENEEDKQDLATAVNATSDNALRNSTTHNAKWKKFVRACSNRKKFPVALSETFLKDPIDLFSVWLDNGENLERCVAIVQRKASKKTESKTLWTQAGSRIQGL
jgi:hypothetical protein